MPRKPTTIALRMKGTYLKPLLHVRWQNGENTSQRQIMVVVVHQSYFQQSTLQECQSKAITTSSWICNILRNIKKLEWASRHVRWVESWYNVRSKFEGNSTKHSKNFQTFKQEIVKNIAKCKERSKRPFQRGSQKRLHDDSANDDSAIDKMAAIFWHTDDSATFLFEKKDQIFFPTPHGFHLKTFPTPYGC